jgi:hypothetical protein
MAILLLKKTPKHHGQGNFLKKIHKKSPHLKEKCFEIAKSFGGLGQIF